MSKLHDELDATFSAFDGERWSRLDGITKKEILSELESIFSDPENISQIGNLDEAIQNYKSKNWDIWLLFLGILLGLSGSLVANLFDRYLTQYGYIYDGSIIIVFLFSVYLIWRTLFNNAKEGVKLTGTKLAMKLSKLGIGKKLDSN
jgi:hypothetical protein